MRIGDHKDPSFCKRSAPQIGRRNDGSLRPPLCIKPCNWTATKSTGMMRETYAYTRYPHLCRLFDLSAADVRKLWAMWHDATGVVWSTMPLQATSMPSCRGRELWAWTGPFSPGTCGGCFKTDRLCVCRRSRHFVPGCQLRIRPRAGASRALRARRCHLIAASLR